MPSLNQNNSTVDKESGAVIFHQSPELQEIVKLKKEIRQLNGKVDELIELLKGGIVNGQKMG